LLLFACLGCLAIQPWVAPRLPTNHIAHFAGPKRYLVMGTLADEPFGQERRLKMTIGVAKLVPEGSAEVIPVTGRLRLTLTGEPIALYRGDRIAFTGKIRGVRNFNNPGGFDYQRYMAFKRIWTTTYADAQKIEILARSPRTGIRSRIEQARLTVSRRVMNCGYGSHDARAILAALTVGDRTGISKSLREDFKRAFGNVLSKQIIIGQLAS
jgi:competence protein ComEC